LRLRLRLGEAPDIAQVPWEYMHGSVGDGFLALQTDTAVVRYLELPHSRPPLAAELPLSILVMISSPPGVGRLDVDREWNRLVEATADLRAKGDLRLDLLERPSLLALQRRLRHDDVHVLHFVGHGGFDVEQDTGVLVMADEDGQPRAVPSKDVGHVVANADSLRLVVLNACEGARSSLRDPFAGVAQHLMERGVPAVVAMQFEITDDAAIAFTEELYRTICEGYPIDAAVAETRLSLYTRGNYVEWATPVLYMRSADGRLFSFAGSGPGGIQPAVGAPIAPTAPPGPLEGTLRRNLIRAHLPVSVQVDDLEVVVHGVVDDADAAETARQVVTSSLLAAGASRVVTLDVVSLAERLTVAVEPVVDDVRVDVDPSAVAISGRVNTVEDEHAMMRSAEEELATLGAQRSVSSKVTVIESSLSTGLARAAIEASIDVTDTDVVIRLTDATTDPAVARGLVETVLATLGIGRMVRVDAAAGALAPDPARPAPVPPAETVTAPPPPLTAPQPAAPPPAPVPGSPGGRMAARRGWLVAALALLLVLAASMPLVLNLGEETSATSVPGTAPAGSDPTAPPSTGPATTGPVPGTSTPTTLPDVAGALIDEVRAAFEQAMSGVENATVEVSPVAGALRVSVGGVVDDVAERQMVESRLSVAQAGFGEITLVVDSTGVRVVEDEIVAALAAAGHGDLVVSAGAGTVLIEGAVERAGEVAQVRNLIDATLNALDVTRVVELGSVRLLDVEVAFTETLAVAGYEGAEVTATVDEVTVRYVAPPGGDPDVIGAAIAELYAASGLTQDLTVVVIGSDLPHTGPEDRLPAMAALGVMLVTIGCLLLGWERRRRAVSAILAVEHPFAYDRRITVM
jgi:hypothetical protein